jgi:hypothetical protein
MSEAVGEGGGTVTTDDEGGDGATPSDPIETTVTIPAAGQVTIQEAPITEPEPEGWAFITQQVNITAPASTAEEPLVFVFELDETRLPDGVDETNLGVFRNGVLVPDCSGPAGVADPDPCVALRERLPDGDVRLTVLTSAASAWNLGVLIELEDADGDGIEDELDACPDQAEDFDGNQDADGCPELEDADGDGILDSADHCPFDAEDFDGDSDLDGCPEADPPSAPCADFDDNGVVDKKDVRALRKRLRTGDADPANDATFDLDQDGQITRADLKLARAQVGMSCE